MNGYTERVKVGAFYTDGHHLAEVTRVYPLGHIQMRDPRTGDWIGVGIKAFRERWWLVKEAEAA